MSLLGLFAAAVAFLVTYMALKTLGNVAVEVASILGALAVALIVYSLL